MVAFLIIAFILVLNIGVYIGKKVQFDNDKKLFNIARNDEQLLDIVYNHYELIKKNKND